MSAETRAVVLASCASRPVAERGHGATVQVGAPDDAEVVKTAVALCNKTPGLDYQAALKMARGN